MHIKYKKAVQEKCINRKIEKKLVNGVIQNAAGKEMLFSAEKRKWNAFYGET